MRNCDNGNISLPGPDLPMAYKSILAYLPSAARSAGVCTCAAVLAKDHEAHLTALTVTPDTGTLYAYAGEVATHLLDAQKEAGRKGIAEIERTCSDIARQHCVELELRHVDSKRSLVADVILDHAITSDVVVMAQATGQERGAWSELPDRVILHAGRPALIVPDDMTVERPPRKVLVAWTDSPQSARAVFDALPLLRNADEVEVVAIQISTSDNIERSLAVDQIALALARHGVRVKASTEQREHISVGEAILDHAREMHADALVMGCYGHSRFHEALMGGVSRMILHEPTLPVLMSH